MNKIDKLTRRMVHLLTIASEASGIPFEDLVEKLDIIDHQEKFSDQPDKSNIDPEKVKDVLDKLNSGEYNIGHNEAKEKLSKFMEEEHEFHPMDAFHDEWESKRERHTPEPKRLKLKYYVTLRFKANIEWITHPADFYIETYSVQEAEQIAHERYPSLVEDTLNVEIAR